MDVYQRVLVKLYEVTGGKESETVDLKEMVKGLGFLGSYPDILQQLSRQSFITETPRPGTVRMTHWGVKAAQKAGAGETGGGQENKKEINRMVAETKELIIFLEELSQDISTENIARAEKKLGDIKSALQKLKENI